MNCGRGPSLRALLATLALLAGGSAARAQISVPAINRDAMLHNSVGFAGSIGTPYTRDAYFWGLAADYTRVIRVPWSTSASIAFDQEHDQPQGAPKTVVNTFTFILTVNWSAASWVTLTTGVGKGFLDDDNRDERLKFTNGDWSTGIAAGIGLPNLPFTLRDAFTLNASWEYNLTKKDPMLSVDLGASWSF